MPAGRPYKFTPKQLQKRIDKYFKHLEENPMWKYDVVKTGEFAGKELKIKVPAMPSVQGLCVSLDIDYQTFYNFISQKWAEKNKKLFDISMRAKLKIEAQQIQGAGNGLYQPLIVSRLNHLKDEQEVTSTTIDATGKSAEEVRAAIQAIEKARRQD